MSTNDRFLSLVKEVKSRVKQVDADSVKAMQDNQELFHLIDVREANEWQRGYLQPSIR